MINKKELTIRPYARLLTMLGEQLIKNERIALIELIKNSYDADSPWVKVSFLGFKENYEKTNESKIVIEDSGCGMNSEILEKHWLNPATPEKKLRKENNPITKKGRVIQGDKGIGRFAILKLGRIIRVITRPEGENVEYILEYDLGKYDDEFLTESGKNKELYIDDIKVSLTSRTPETFIEESFPVGIGKYKKKPHGTRIEISNLKGSWSDKKIKDIYGDITRLESIFENKEKNEGLSDKNSFQVKIFKDNDLQQYHENYIEKLNNLLNDRAVIKIENGIFDDKKKAYSFLINGKQESLKLDNPEITGLYPFKSKFGDRGIILNQRDLECGPFSFSFYIFDLTPKAPMKYQLDKEDKDIIKNHRIYLYRDGIRVYPYGEPDDDWLKIDISRGTISAKQFLSNDQVVGFVKITQKNNPHLKDKTNREGLIEEGNATDDLITLIQTFLAYIRRKPYDRYRLDLENKKVQDIYKTEQVQKEIEELKKAVKGNKKAEALLTRTENEYKKERQYLIQRAETTEELAGVGLSVETASHDIMAIMSRVLMNLDSLISDLMHNMDIVREILLKELQSIRGGMGFIEAQLKDIQLLFKSSKQRRKTIKIKEIIEKVERIYKGLLSKEKIDFSIHEIGSPLIAKTTDAVLLQLLLNLIDNSTYWLKQVSRTDKKIEILLDGQKGKMIFSDNGPGVDKEDAPYIFEPFYSGKGEEGRGLGLYIARQLLERNDYSIELAELKSDKKLSGANFIVNFIAEGDE